MKEVEVSKIILLSLIAVVMSTNFTNWFYQWMIAREVNPLFTLEFNTLEMTMDFLRFLSWFCLLLVVPLFADRIVNVFRLSRAKFATAILGIESVLFIYSFGLASDLLSGLYFFVFCQLPALVNGIAIYRSL